ncbi:MAG: DUF3343 domain-containing protein [Spirochaetaceae bacterium]|nr:DUF3343 domain-containing protein [Spirochaetaceae bacterium]
MSSPSNEIPLTEVYAIFLFPNTHFAIQAERVAHKHFPERGIRLIPLPPEVSAGCGMVLRTAYEDASQVLHLLHDENVSIEAYYTLRIVDHKRQIDPLTI